MSAVGSVTADVLGMALHSDTVMHGQINIYPIWYNQISPLKTWPSSAQSVIRTFLNNVSTNRWWSTFWQYPNQEGLYATSMSIVQECTDPGNEGTSEDICGDSGGLPNVISNNLVGGGSGCNLPIDPNGIYVIMPAALSAFGSDGCHIWSPPPGVSANAVDPRMLKTASVYLYDCPYPSNPGCFPGYPFPNGHIGFGGSIIDGMIEQLSHELAETITNPTGFGWNYGAGSAEIADACESSTGGGTAGYGSGWYTAPNGQLADLHAGGGDFVVQDLWQRAPANTCYGGALPTMPQPMTLLPYNTPFLQYGVQSCNSNADCAGGTIFGTFLCVNRQCLQPSCSNGVQDGYESDVDCGAVCSQNGGSESTICHAGQKCFTGFDCNTANCIAGICH